MQYRLMSSDGSISHKLFSLKDARFELKSSAIIAIVTPRSHKIVETSEVKY
jgi:hypothetical protein